MSNCTPILRKDFTIVSAVFFFTLIGPTIRLAPALQTQFPLNNSGLFYAMIQDLREANY